MSSSLMSSSSRSTVPGASRSVTMRSRSSAYARSEIRSVAELTAAAGDELLQLPADGLVDRRRLVGLERRAPDLRRAVGGVLAAVARPAVEVLGRGQQRPVEALAEPLERVGGTEEVAALADLLVRAERQARLVDLQRRELVPQHPQQLDVDDELLVARHEAALEPAGRVHDEVGAGQERRQQRHQRLVGALRVGRLARGQAAAAAERQPEVTRD